MNFLSVCSGIEAASVAWGPLGWKAIGFSEIEPFPSAVLKHHYPEVPNYGDMTALPERIRSGEVEAPDLLCGGTPCQAFSVAGLRKSLEDARGNLTLTFCEIANAIDDVRVSRGLNPAIIFWENVPGVLNTNDNAFGCFLGALGGEDGELKPAGKRWSNAGVVFGPQRTVAWRVLDAQYFGVAQRRRRVFVVASARDGFDCAKVLFEFEGVRRNTPPSRETRESVAGTIEASLGRSRGAGTPPAAITACMVAFGEYVDDGTASAMKARDWKDATDLVAQPMAFDWQSGGDSRGLDPKDTAQLQAHQIPAVLSAMAVRRLTPTECERLQGFPDGYTNIKENCPDGPRYKALGNSMAVPVVAWIGARIQAQLRAE